MKITINGAYDFVDVRDVAMGYINTLQSNSYISSEKASKELGYNSRPVRKSIEDTFKWFKENKIL